MNSKTGISLIELVLAAGILAALMIPVTLSFSLSSSGIQMTSEELIAHAAAMELLEQTMAIPFKLLPTGTFSHEKIQDQNVMDPAQSPVKFRISPVKDIEIRRKLEISPVIQNGKTRFKKIEVEISWNPKERKNDNRKILFRSLLANEED